MTINDDDDDDDLSRSQNFVLRETSGAKPKSGVQQQSRLQRTTATGFHYQFPVFSVYPVPSSPFTNVLLYMYRICLQSYANVFP